MLEAILLAAGCATLVYGLHMAYIKTRILHGTRRYQQMLQGTGLALAGVLLLYGSNLQAGEQLVVVLAALLLALASFVTGRWLGVIDDRKGVDER